MIIAIDGTAASGKGTLAKRIAAHFGLHHLDTGLLYRAVARDVQRLGGVLEGARERRDGVVEGEAHVGEQRAHGGHARDALGARGVLGGFVTRKERAAHELLLLSGRGHLSLLCVRVGGKVVLGWVEGYL